MDQSEGLALPSSIVDITMGFWTWVYNDLFHSPHGVQRQGRWEPVGRWAEYRGAADRGINYEWVTTGAVSTLILCSDTRSLCQARSVATDIERPPFTLLMRCWFDLLADADLLAADDHARLLAELDQFKTREVVEYGQL